MALVAQQQIVNESFEDRLSKLCGRLPQYVPAPCKLIFHVLWPWKWCPSHVRRRLPLCQFSLPRHICSRLRSDVGLRDRQTDVRQTDRQTSDVRRASSLNAFAYRGGGITRPLCLQGDSGSPLACRDQEGTWNAIGINSFGWNYCEQNVMTRVSTYVDWIQQTISRYV